MSVIPGEVNATRRRYHGIWSDGWRVPAKGVDVHAGTDGLVWETGGESTANYKLYDDRLDNRTLDDASVNEDGGILQI